jgi:hypothetical protein
MYAKDKNIAGIEAYRLFKEKGILNMLDQDYEVLHGFGFEYVINDIDECLRNGGYAS